MDWHKKAKEQWDGFAGGWASNSSDMWEKGSRKNIIPLFSQIVPKGAKVCDIGCGDGYGSTKLQSMGYNVIGLDLSGEMIELAKSRVQDKTMFVQGDLAELPFRDEEFDAVMVINTIEWAEHPLKALNEINRVVQSGGYACFGILGPLAGPRKAHRYKRFYGEKVIMNSMMPWEFEKMALENGWELAGEMWVEKKEAKKDSLPPLPKELQQALCFMWLFMLKKNGSSL